MRMGNISWGRCLPVAVVGMAGLALGGCATEEYVNQQIAAVNGRIDGVDSRVTGVDRTAQEGVRRADAAGNAAEQAAHAAAAADTAAQAAASDAARANKEIDEIQPVIVHLQLHHLHRTWAEGSRKKTRRKARCACTKSG
jgi:hypothetical protein